MRTPHPLSFQFLALVVFALLASCVASTDTHQACDGGKCDIGGDDFTCGGTTCGAGQFCFLEANQNTCDASNAAGLCAATSSTCDTFVVPVCGCDGHTYDNACVASKSHAGIAHQGACALPPPTCGNQTCGAGEFCFLDPNQNTCGASTEVGLCAATTYTCDTFVDAVCGCDGQTYDNVCFASKAGAGIAHHGRCAAPHPTCSGVTCAADEFCWRSEGVNTCGLVDQPGLCSPTASACPAFHVPVCGCDGHTYDNTCFASKANASIAHAGPCS